MNCNCQNTNSLCTNCQQNQYTNSIYSNNQSQLNQSINQMNTNASNQSYYGAFPINYWQGMQNSWTSRQPTKKELLSTEVYDFLQDIKLQIFNHLPDDTELTMNEVLHQIEKMIKMRSFL